MFATAKNVIRPIYWFFVNWRIQFIRAQVLFWNFRAQKRYTLLDEADFRASRRSDTLFIFGSGYSLNNLKSDDWAHIAQHDTMGFNFFIYQHFVRVDYHVFRELSVNALKPRTWLPVLEAYARDLNDNPTYKDTILLLQSGWSALAANALVGRKVLNLPRRILRFRNRRSLEMLFPTSTLSAGVIHHMGTLSDAIHLGYIGGWKHIVIAGVDLYDRRYFWLSPDQLRDNEEAGSDIDAPHLTASRGMVDFVGKWGQHLAKDGVKLWCLNPKSLLAEVLPIYQLPTDQT